MFRNFKFNRNPFAQRNGCVADSGSKMPDSVMPNHGADSRIRGITQIVLLSICLVWLSLTAGAQSLSVYPSSLSATVDCGEKTTKAVTIENYGSQALTYTAKLNVEFSNSAGRILEEYRGFPLQSIATVWVGEYLYVLSDNSIIYKYDTTTQSSVNLFNSNFSVSSMSYDGQYLWLSGYDSKAYAFTIDGKPTNVSFNLPSISDPIMVFDGEYFIVASRYNSNTQFYKVDHSGNIITTYGAAGFYFYALTMAPDGNLWVKDYSNIAEISLSGDQAEVIDQFYFNPIEDSYSMVQDGTDVYIGYYSGFLTRCDDGYVKNSFALKNASGTVNPGNSANISVDFDATGLNSGNYSGYIQFSTNDPQNESYDYYFDFYVNGDTLISLSDTNFIFGETYIGAAPVKKTVTIGSSSCRIIQMNNITSSNAAFTVDKTNFMVYPDQPKAVTISFNPSSLGDYADTLTLSYDGLDTTIVISGTCIDPPTLVINTDSIIDTLNSCGITVTKTVTIGNSGTAPLTYSILPKGATNVLALTYGVNYNREYANTLSAINENYTNYTLSEINTTNASELGDALIGKDVLLIPDLQNANSSVFTGFASTLQNFVSQGGRVVFCGTNNYGYINNTGLLTSSNYWGYGTGSNFYIPDHSNALLEGVVDPYTSSSECYLLYFTNGDVEKLIFNYNGSGYAHLAYRPYGEGDIVYIGNDFINYDSNAARVIANAVNHSNNLYCTIVPLSGVVNASEDATVSISFSNEGLLAGNYTGEVKIITNDLNQEFVSIPYRFTNESGQPILNLSKSNFDFGNIVNGASRMDTLWIANTGCDTLNITEIVSSNEAFSVSLNDSSILIGEKAAVIIEFAPELIGTYKDTLVIFSNADAVEVLVNGVSIVSPVMVVTPDTIAVAVTSCGGSATANFNIANTLANGNTKLTYQCKMVGLFNPNDAGQTLKTYNGSTYYSDYGMVKVGHYLYIANGNNYSIDQYDLNNQTLNTITGLPFQPSGITFDGTSLWVGSRNNSNMVAYDLEGNDLGTSITLPFNDPCITIDGTHFIVAKRWTNNPTIYVIDHSGNVVESYTSSIGYLYDLTWVPEHNSLWVKDSYYYLTQVSLSDGIATNDNYIYYYNYIYAIAHDGTDLLLGHSDSRQIYRVHDGIYEAQNWMTLSSTSGTINPGASATLTARVKANMNAGLYKANILVTSNDANNACDTVLCLFTISGTPKKQLSATSFNFGNIFSGYSATDTLVIRNTGCDVLTVNGIDLSGTSFSTDHDYDFEVAPGSEELVMIYFNPSSVASFTSTLSLTTNDGNVNISLRGSGIAVPSVTLSSDLIMDTLACSGNTSSTFNVANIGQGGLSYANTIVYDDVFNQNEFGDIIKTYNNANYWNSGMAFANGNLYFANQNNYSIVRYDTLTQQQTGNFGVGYWPCGIAYDGQYLWVGNSEGLLQNYDLNGNAMGDTIVTGVSNPFFCYDGTNFMVTQGWRGYGDIYKINHSGKVLATYSTNLNYVYALNWSASHNALWAIDQNNGYKIVQLKLSGSSAIINHTVNSGFSDSYSIGHDGTDLLYCQYNGTIYRVDDGITENIPKWISVANTSGNINPGASATMSTTFTSNGLTVGTYTGGVLVNTNDPAQPTDTVYCSLTVEGVANIDLNPEDIDMADVVYGTTGIDTLFVTNTGCDTLRVTSISTALGIFDVSVASMEVLPGNTYPLVVSIDATSTGDFIDSLFITSNVSLDTVVISTTVIDPSVLAVSPLSVTGTINSCEGTIEQSFNISNNATLGNGTLSYVNNVASDYDASKAGHIIESYEGLREYNTGMVFVDGYLYVVNSNNYKLMKYDTATMSVVAEHYLGFAPSGMTYDGEYLWISYSYDTRMYKFSLDGQNLGYVSIPTSYSTLAYDGEYIIVARKWQANPTIYKVNQSGSVVESLTSSNIGYLYGITYGNGTLWMMDNYNYLKEFGLSSGTATMIHSINLSGDFYSLDYVDGDLWMINYNDFYLYKIYDGVDDNPSYISLSDYENTVNPQGSSTIKVKFNAKGLASGTYNGKIVVESNDPANITDTVAYNFVVDGEPVMSMSTNSISFPEVPLNSNEAYQVVDIFNTGCDTLFITSINSSSSVFSSNLSNLEVLPYSSEKIYVSFSPDAFGTVNGTLTLYNNYNTDTVISLTGIGAQTKAVSVVATTADGFYNEGKVIQISTRFSKDINLTDNGDVTLKLNTTPVAYATLTEIDGRDAIFEYTVGANENSADLDYSIDTLTLNGSIIADYNGNAVKNSLPPVGTFAALYSIVIDNVKPSVVIGTTGSNPTNVSPVPVMVSFSESAMGLDLSDLTITNGTATSMVQSTSSSFTVYVQPVVNGNITVSLPAGKATDLAGNSNTVSNTYSIFFDSNIPVMNLTSIVAGLTNSNPIPVTITSSVPVTDLELQDIVVVNGTASSLSTVTEGLKWTVNITPTVDGEVKVTLPANSVTNQNSSPNIVETSISFTYDGSVPLFTLTSVGENPTKESPIEINIALSENALGFDAADVTISNGTLLNFTNVSELLWSATVKPITSGEVIVTIPAGKVSDNVNSNAAASITIHFDNAQPTVVISSSETLTNTKPIAYTIAFSEKVNGFASADIEMVNGSVSSLQTTDSITFTANVNPVADGLVSMSISDSVAYDWVGNANLIADQFSVLYDAVLPQIISISSNTITEVSAKVVFTGNENGKLYYALLRSDATPPTADQIVDGTVGAVSKGNLSVSANTNAEVEFTDLQSDAAYVVYAVLEDALEIVSEVELHSFTTLKITSINEKYAGISIYPNPVIDQLNIDLGQFEGSFTYRIYAINGQMVAEGIIDNLKSTIDVVNLSQGTFSLQIMINNTVKTFKVIKQ